MENLRPKYHITAKENWINDPNGVVKYKGKYHVFYQHHPHSIHWGEMNWGHVVSDDLLHFKHLPHALTPGHKDDLDHCFSGSAIVKDDTLYLFYTGLLLMDGKENEIQQQCMAYSNDGINFVKHGLVVGKAHLPSTYAFNDFRDPCVYEDNGVYYMLVACKKINGKGNILKFKSLDLINWEYVTDILKEGSKGVMVECPDYIKDLNLLIHCEQYQPIDGYMHHNIHSTFYDIGYFDKDDKFISQYNGTVDYGFDMYAPQVIKGDNILIGWMNMWDRNNPSEKYGFSGSLTIPRKIDVIDGQLHQTPILPNKIKSEISIKKHYEEHVKIGFYKLEIEDLSSFSLKIRKGKKHVTTFDLINDEWVFNRSKSGEPLIGVEQDIDSINGIRRFPLIKSDKYTMYIVLDEFSVELFVNGISLTSLIYPDLDDDLMELDVEANDVKLTKYDE